MEELLKQLLEEIKGLRSDLNNKDLDICTPDQAIAILGVNNKRYLTYFHKQNLLNRRKGGKSFVYYKSECRMLADKVRQHLILIPSINEIHGK